MVDDPGEFEIDALIADSVAASEGKLYVQGGGWDTIWTPILPFRHSRVGIGVVLRVAWGATNQLHQFSVKVVDHQHGEAAAGMVLEVALGQDAGSWKVVPRHDGAPVQQDVSPGLSPNL